MQGPRADERHTVTVDRDLPRADTLGVFTARMVSMVALLCTIPVLGAAQETTRSARATGLEDQALDRAGDEQGPLTAPAETRPNVASGPTDATVGVSERSAADEPLAEAPDNGAEGVPAPEATSRSSLGWTDERGVAWATFGASLLVGIAGAIVLAVGVDDRRSVENAPDGTRWSTVRERYERAPWLLGTGLAAAVVGAVGVGCGAALLAWSGEGGTWLEVAIVGSGARVRGRF